MNKTFKVCMVTPSGHKTVCLIDAPTGRAAKMRFRRLIPCYQYDHVFIMEVEQ